jgi:hypothetical protein
MPKEAVSRVFSALISCLWLGCPLDELFIGRVVHWAICQFGESTIGPVIVGRAIMGRYYGARCYGTNCHMQVRDSLQYKHETARDFVIFLVFGPVTWGHFTR